MRLMFSVCSWLAPRRKGMIEGPGREKLLMVAREAETERKIQGGKYRFQVTFPLTCL